MPDVNFTINILQCGLNIIKKRSFDSIKSGNDDRVEERINAFNE
jgi:hypothetical protein